jgi:hypothetical protein
MNGFSNDNFTKGSDAVSAFWADLMSKMSTAGIGRAAQSPQDEMFRQMRQAFFDAWGQYCEEFMRSPSFLETMRKSMENALAFRQQVNEYLSKALHEGQAPARSDTDSILLVLRSLEDRVLSRVEELAHRVDELHEKVSRVSPPSAATATSGPTRTKGGSR